MKLLLHNEDFSKTFLEKLFEAYNNHKKTDGKIEIYISSNGGKLSALHAALHIINSQPEKFKIVGYAYLYSAGFEFYMCCLCEKELLPMTSGMFHLAYSPIDLNDRNRPAYASDVAEMEKNKKFYYPHAQQIMKLCEFTPSEIKKVTKGDDFYMQFDRMKEMEVAYLKNINPLPNS